MSKKYSVLTGEVMEKITSDEMREFSKRPGKVDENGNIIYTTEQSHKDQCDVNRIINKYDKTGLLNHVTSMEMQYGDCTGLDYKEALDKVTSIRQAFDTLPNEIRKRFKNSPEEYFNFMSNPENRKEAIELGLIRRSWTEQTDGLGEFVKDGKHEEIEAVEGK